MKCLYPVEWAQLADRGKTVGRVLRVGREEGWRAGNEAMRQLHVVWDTAEEVAARRSGAWGRQTRATPDTPDPPRDRPALGEGVAGQGELLHQLAVATAVFGQPVANAKSTLLFQDRGGSLLKKSPELGVLGSSGWKSFPLALI